MSFPKRARFRFYAELNDFLPPASRFRTLERSFEGRPSVKDMIESFGVPHTEVDLVVVRGDSVPFSHAVSDGELVSVYPMFESVDISPVLRLRSAPLREIRFVADANLGQLARYLRLLGFDTIYARDGGDAEVAEISARQHRVLLTRDVGLLKRNVVTHGYYVRAGQPRVQATEVLRRFDIAEAVRPFTRCMECNGTLVNITPEEAASRVPERTRRRHREFTACDSCGRVCWRGSHHARLTALVEDLVRASGVHG